jgi:hypothetical protein
VKTLESPAVPDAARNRPERVHGRVFGAVVLAIVVLAIAGLGLAVRAKARGFSHPGTPPLKASHVLPYGAWDTFPGTGRSLGHALSGQPWLELGGTWARGGHSARLQAGDASTSLALINMGSSDGTVRATITPQAAGAGVVFRCVGPTSCWSVRTVAATHQWAAVELTPAGQRVVATLGAYAPGVPVPVQVAARGTHVTVSIDRLPPATFTAADAPVSTVGLIAAGDDHLSSWADFTAIPEPSPGLLTSSSAPVRDDFARASNPRSLGVATTGQAWKVLSGRWARHPGSAYLTRVGPTRTALAIIDTGFTNGTVEASLGMIDNGAGVAFRCLDADNCWSVQAVPGYATWAVYRTIGGSTTQVGTLGEIGSAPGTTVTVRMQGPAITVLLDGQPRFNTSDPSLVGATGAGLVLQAPRLERVSWVRFLARPASSR